LIVGVFWRLIWLDSPAAMGCKIRAFVRVSKWVLEYVNPDAAALALAMLYPSFESVHVPRATFVQYPKTPNVVLRFPFWILRNEISLTTGDETNLFSVEINDRRRRTHCK
jgi:hypothetical protein